MNWELPPAMDLETDRILALAPDPSSAAAARKLASSGSWHGLGRSAEALWGECRGSALYQVRVDLHDLSAKCSCPSRKFPCKHSLALMLLGAMQTPNLRESTMPEWVSAWLAGRAARAAAGHAPTVAVTSEDQQARQARRVEKRSSLVQQGIDSLDLWLQDLIRTGLAGVELQRASCWEKQAARLVDSQAPGLAARVRRLALIPGSSPRWPEQLLCALGSLALLIEAYRRLDALDPVTSELVRLRGARQHRCRLCMSIRSRPALLAGADESTFAAVDDYEHAVLDPLPRAALAFTDGMLWTPGRLDPAVVADLAVRATPAQQVELVLDVTRNALNKIAVALGADAAHVEDGTEIYDVAPDGSLVYGLRLE